MVQKSAHRRRSDPHRNVGAQQSTKRYSHQRRIKRAAIQESLAILSRLEGRIRSCADFSSLFKLVKDELADVPGIGELYVYDTALCIGAKGVLPEKVYLHAGTRSGARNLGLIAIKQPCA